MRRRRVSPASLYIAVESLYGTIKRALAVLRTQPLTEFPLRSLIVVDPVLSQLALHLSETLNCLRHATILFEDINITDHPVYDEVELIRRDCLNVQLQTIT